MPPLPQYCLLVNVPGQCCPTVSCNIPNHGTYNPVPELTGQNLPTPGPTQPSHGHRTTPAPQVSIRLNK
jgi:hypothetical protein